MKRILVPMTLMGALLVVASGVAWAVTVNCQVGVPCVGTNDPDRLNGTNSQTICTPGKTTTCSEAAVAAT